LLVSVALAAASTPAAAKPEQGRVLHLQAKERVMIGFENMPGAADVAAVEAAGGIVRAQYSHFPVLGVEVPVEALNGLRNNPRVRYVELDQLRFADAQTLPWGIDHVEADLAWPTTQGEGSKVAVLDTGGDPDHPDLSYAGGVNFAGWLRDGRTAPKWWNDGNGHGTWTSGTVAALDNTIGVVGVAPAVSVYAVKVLSNSGSGWDSDIAQGIDWAIGADMDVISMSLGGPGYSAALAEACQSAWDAGLVIVAASGNEGDGNPATEELSYPAALPTVMSIGASNPSDGLASFSNTGSHVSLVAPGVSVQSTYKGGGYATGDGTSAACPHVAGAAALALAADPTLTNAQVWSLLTSTARDLGPAGWDPGFGDGLVDAATAVGAIASPVVYDAAVTSLSAPGAATLGDLVGVDVEVANYGAYTETFHLTVLDTVDSEEFGSTDVTLAAGAKATYSFTWDTTGNSTGDHTLLAWVTLAGDERPENDSRTTEVNLTIAPPPVTGLDISVTTDQAVYARGQRVYITVLATDGGSPAVPLGGVYNFVEVVTASGNLYIGDGFTAADGQSVYRFKPKTRDGFGTYFVVVLGDSGLYQDADSTTFEVVR
jgi:subtilisin